MDYEAGKALLHLGIGLPMLGFIYFRLLPRVRREAFQQELFRVRNDLFEEMWKRKLPFNDDAYQQTRSTLNGAIRWAENFSIPTFLMVAFAIRKQKKSPSPKLPEDGEFREILDKAYTQLAMHFLRYLWFRVWLIPLVPVGFAIAAVIMICNAAAGTWRSAIAKIRNLYREPADIFMEESMQIGTGNSSRCALTH